MSEPPEIKSIEAVAAHLWHVQQALQAQSAKLDSMARQAHDDIKDIKQTIAGLATKVELEQKVAAIREEFQRASPQSMLQRLAVFAGQVVVITAALGGVMAVVHWIEDRPPRNQQPATPAAKANP